MVPTPPNEGKLGLLSFAYEAQILAGPDTAVLVDVRHTREIIICSKERFIGPRHDCACTCISKGEGQKSLVGPRYAASQYLQTHRSSSAQGVLRFIVKI
jgi:hypothetical protein